MTPCEVEPFVLNIPDETSYQVRANEMLLISSGKLVDRRLGWETYSVFVSEPFFPRLVNGVEDAQLAETPVTWSTRGITYYGCLRLCL